MLKKIERMVTGIGQTSVDALITWFPGNTKDEILNEIVKSDILAITDNIVFLKSDITLEEKRVLKKEISFTHVVEESATLPQTQENIKNRLIELSSVDLKEIETTGFCEPECKDVESENNVSYSKIIKLLFKYNKMVQEKYIDLTTSNFENYKNAVINYYKERYDIRKKTGSFSEVETFSLLHKTNGFEVATLLITPLLNDSVTDFLEENFKSDTVYICAYNIFGEAPKFTSREFYIKDSEDILNEYMAKFNLVKEDCTILKIHQN